MSKHIQEQVWEVVRGVTPPACNHALRNLYRWPDDEIYECRKCDVRKRYCVSPSGRRTLISSRAIQRVT